MMYLHRNLEDPNHGRRTGTEKVSSGWGEGEFDNPCFIDCVYKAYPNHRFYRSLRRLGRGLSQRLKGTIPLSKELSILVMYSKVCISFSAKQHFKCEIPLHRHLPFSPSTLPVKIYLKLNAKNQDPFYSLINHPRIMQTTHMIYFRIEDNLSFYTFYSTQNQEYRMSFNQIKAFYFTGLLLVPQHVKVNGPWVFPCWIFLDNGHVKVNAYSGGRGR